MQTDKNLKSTFDFNSILNWFGNYTPQFKHFLFAFQKLNDNESFFQIAGDIFQLFRKYLLAASRINPGPERAMWSHKIIDEEVSRSPVQKVSCKKGCDFCCHFEKHITQDEAELIIDYTQTHKIEFSRASLLEQSQRYKNGTKWDSRIVKENRCVFLDENGACSIYPVRPAVCRKHRVTSPATECRKGPDGQIEADNILIAEIVTSAVLSLPDNSFGPMPTQLEEIDKIKNNLPLAN